MYFSRVMVPVFVGAVFLVFCGVAIAGAGQERRWMVDNSLSGYFHIPLFGRLLTGIQAAAGVFAANTSDPQARVRQLGW
ncbi:MAG TPA: hypothetical protein VIM41_12165 [Gammaproteobacteria bacterium]